MAVVSDKTLVLYTGLKESVNFLEKSAYICSRTLSMGATKPIPNYSYKDCLNREGRWELIEGIPFAKSPMVSPRHQLIANKLGRLFDECLDFATCNCQVYQPIDVKIKENTVVNPDLLIVYEEIGGQFLERSFPFAIEILSPSTKIKDKVTKYSLYEEFGVKYYVIVDPDDNFVRIFKLNEEGKYQEQEEYVFGIGDNCKIEADFQKVFLA